MHVCTAKLTVLGGHPTGGENSTIVRLWITRSGLGTDPRLRQVSSRRTTVHTPTAKEQTANFGKGEGERGGGNKKIKKKRRSVGSPAPGLHDGTGLGERRHDFDLSVQYLCKQNRGAHSYILLWKR